MTISWQQIRILSKEVRDYKLLVLNKKNKTKQNKGKVNVNRWERPLLDFTT